MKDTTLPSVIKLWEKKTQKYLTHKNYSAEILVKEYDWYVDFITRKLKLWMFIPCNDKGDPLEEPVDESINYDITDSFGNELYHTYEKLKEEYQKAQSRVLFKEVIDFGWVKHYLLTGEFLWEGKLIKQILDLEGKVQLTNKQHELLNL